MTRQPALMDPRTPIPPAPPAPTRLVPWSYVWFAALVLTVAAGVAWFAADPAGRLSTLNLQSGSADKDGKPAGGAKVDGRAVAIAYVDVEKGVTPLYPVRTGRVVELYVNEGDAVKERDKLFKIDDTFSREQLDEAKLALEGAKKKKQHAEQLVEQHRQGVKAQEAKIAVRRADVAVAQANAKKARRFFEDRLGGSREDVDIAQRSVEKAEAAVRAEEAELERIKAMNPELGVETAELEIQAKEQQLKKAKLDLEHFIVRAPADGKILRSFVTLGETLGSNPMRPAMQFAPDGERIVRAEVEQEFAGSVRPGLKATVQDYDATDSTVWEGEVSRVSGWIADRRSKQFEPLQFNDVRTLEVIIKLKGEAKNQLRIGQRVRVTME